MEGIGSYFASSPMDAVPFGAYFATPVAQPPAVPTIVTASARPMPAMAGTSGSGGFSFGSGITIAIAAVAGYLVGRQIGYPIAGAVATGLLGMPGMLGVAIYSSYKKKTAVANRRRSRRSR